MGRLLLRSGAAELPEEAKAVQAVEEGEGGEGRRRMAAIGEGEYLVATLEAEARSSQPPVQSTGPGLGRRLKRHHVFCITKAARSAACRGDSQAS